MYRKYARDGRDMFSASRLTSKRVTKTLHFRKVLENEGFEVSKKWTQDLVFGDFKGYFGVNKR